jgi:pimeloyl-ACP methyl ester carboxylesterase
MLRRYAMVGSRRVHYRRCGAGPPLVLIHGSPASSEILAAEMQALSGDCTCFAFDTPGFGDSAPLASATIDIPALADALAETLRSLRFPACPVFGSHTGAAIAIELARRHPQQVAGLILDGVPMYTPREQRELFDGYFAPLRIDDLGGHFASTWTRFRDLFLWFPWNRKRPENLNDAERPTAQRLQLWVSMFYRAAGSFAVPYRAAIAWGAEAADAIRALHVPAVFMAQDSDMLRPHLERLPPLQPGQVVERPDRAGKLAMLVAAARRFAVDAPAPDDPLPQWRAGQPLRHFLDFPQGQVLLRGAGAFAPGTPVTLLLHDAPGSSLPLEAALGALARSTPVLTLDLPGSGESAPLPGPAPSLRDYATLVQQVLARLELRVGMVYGCGFGSSLALELAAGAPQSFPRLLLHGLCLPSSAQRVELQRHYAPPIELQPDGSHWYRTWLMLRDSLVYFPWYAGTPAALRRVPLDFDPGQLHERTFEVLKQAAGYGHFIHAALRQDAAMSCGLVARRGVSVSWLRDPLHPFAVYDLPVATLAAQFGWRVVDAAGNEPLDALAALA